MDLKDFVRSIPDYPIEGVLFRDITTLLKDSKAFEYTIDSMVDLAKKLNIDKVAGIESRGIVFASTVSYLLKKPFILLRKKNKLPSEVYSMDFKLEYGSGTMEVHKDSIDVGESILIIDDLVATGGTAEAAAKIIEKAGAKVAGFIFLIGLSDLNGKTRLQNGGYRSESLIEFRGS